MTTRDPSNRNRRSRQHARSPGAGESALPARSPGPLVSPPSVAGSIVTSAVALGAVVVLSYPGLAVLVLVATLTGYAFVNTLGAYAAGSEVTIPGTGLRLRIATDRPRSDGAGRSRRPESWRLTIAVRKRQHRQ